MLRLVDPSAQQPLVDDVSQYPGIRDTREVPPEYAPYRAEPTAWPTDSGSGAAGLLQPGTLPARSRRSPVLALSAVVAVAALIVGGVLLTRKPPGAPPAPAAGGKSTPASPPAQAGPTIPAEFAGTWTGTATMAAISTPGLMEFQDPVTFTLAAGGRTAHEVDKDCVNTLTLTGESPAVLKFDEPQTAACQAGSVTFTRRGGNLDFRWTDQPPLVQDTAVLHKAGLTLSRLTRDPAEFEPFGGLCFLPAVRVPVGGFDEARLDDLQAVEEGRDFLPGPDAAPVAAGRRENEPGYFLPYLRVVGRQVGDRDVAAGGETVHHLTDHAIRVASTVEDCKLSPLCRLRRGSSHAAKAEQSGSAARGIRTRTVSST